MSELGSAALLWGILTPAPGREVEEEAERVVTPPLHPPPRTPLPSSMPRTGTNPTEPMRPKIVREWEAMFDMQGRKGLQIAFYDFARAQLEAIDKQEEWQTMNASASWNHLLQDEKNGTNHVVGLLHFLPDFMILALLRGELAYRYKNDAQIISYVNDHMPLEDWPGIYINVLHDHDGRWLSGDNMSRTLNILEQYVQGGWSRDPTSLQIQIDNQLSEWAAEEQKIRWLPSDRAKLVLKDWIQNARKIYCSDVTDPTEPFLSCPTEVGWAVQVKSRCKQTLTNTDTPYLFGLLNAVLRQSQPDGPGFPPPLQVLLFPVWKRDEAICRIAEIVGSLLCQSYWFLGGLSCEYAGGMRWDAENNDLVKDEDLYPPSSTQPQWESNAEIICRRLAFCKPLEADRQKQRDWEQIMYDATMVPELAAELEAIRKENQRLQSQANAVREETKKLEAFNERMRIQQVAGIKEGLEILSRLEKNLEEFEASKEQIQKDYDM